MIGYLAWNDGTIEGPDALSAEGLMRASGWNLGNLAFWYTTRRLFDDPIAFVRWSKAGLPKIDLFVIPAANFLGIPTNLSAVTEIIRELDVPCVMVGLGAQSEDEKTLPTLNESALPFLQEVAKRTPYIGVRGEYSARVCRELGISNVQVLGCPSILMNGNPNLGASLADSIARLEPDNIAVHAGCRKESLTDVERELVRYVKLFPGSAYAVQRTPDLVATILREELKPEDAEHFVQMARFLHFREPKELTQFLHRYGYVPTSIDSWAAYLRRFSCSINTRIHGTIMALQDGIPSLCICHDTRTTELAAQLRLPALSISQFLAGRSDINGLFAATEFDGAAFDERRRQIASGYAALFKEVGLTPSAHLLSFTEDRSSRAA